METISIYEAIARNIGDLFAKGTPTNATATSFMSNALIHPLSNQLQGKEVYFYTGGGAGEAKTIITFTPGSNHAVVDPQFSTIPSANSQFIIFKKFETEDYENASNRAMGKAKMIYLDDMVATMQIIATQYEYAVPSGIEYISSLRLVPSGTSDYGTDDEVNRIAEFPPRYWNIECNVGGSYLLIFDSRKIDLDDFNEQWVRVIGQCKPDFGATMIDEDLQEYIINRTTALLSSQRISEGREWLEKFRIFNTMANDLEEYIFRHRFGKRIGA